jgi:hypothetical protein
MSLMLKNNTGDISKIGYVVIADPRNPQAFVYAPPSATKIIGVICESVPKYAMCEIATSGMAKVFVSERTVHGSIIRTIKAGDRISSGTCKTAKSADVPYIRVGTALDTGKGLISVNLNIEYVSSDGSSSSLSGSIKWAYRATTTATTLTDTDYQLECTANTFNVSLPTAIGKEGRVYSVKNSGTGTITVVPSGSEKIDDETSQQIQEDENLVIVSNNANWCVI